MNGVLSGSRGLAGVALSFVIAWALVAVLLLTGTLVAAHQIDRDVQLINPSLSSIKLNTHEVVLARTTERVTARIRTAAAPLTGELADTLATARQIQQTAATILTRAQSINTTVGLIQNTVLAIGSTVSAIGGNVLAIQSSVDGIQSSVHGIQSSVASVGTDASSINASVRSIAASVDGVRASVRGILATGGLIVTAVRGINQRAVAVAGVAGGIGAGLAAVAGDVGLGNAAGTIDGHANAIDCSALLNTPLLGGPTTGCGS